MMKVIIYVSLYRDTHVKLLRPRMASGHLQGRILKCLFT